MACAVLCASALISVASASPARRPVKSTDVWYEGRQITLKPASAGRAHLFTFDGVVLGPVVTGREPRDPRPNLYIVSPGDQPVGRAAGHIAFSLIVNEVPQSEEPAVWDVYWVLVLDPALNADFTGERELLVAAQDGFTPAQDFEFDSIPSAGILRAYLHINSLDALNSYRRDDGTLPRVVIVPAKVAVRASVVDPDNPPPDNSRFGGALSHLHSK